LGLDTSATVAQHARMPGYRGHHSAAQLELEALRDLEVLQRYEGGELLAGIARSVDLTLERVRQIVKASGVAMPREYKCAVKACTTSPRTPNAYCHPHQIRFDRYGDPLGTAPRQMDQHGTIASYNYRRCRCELCRRSNAERALEYKHRMHPEMKYRR
jgi:hypothetical protein